MAQYVLLQKSEERRVASFAFLFFNTQIGFFPNVRMHIFVAPELIQSDPPIFDDQCENPPSRYRTTHIQYAGKNANNSNTMLPTIHEIKEKARLCGENPRLLVTYLWFSTLVVGFMYAITAIVAAVYNNGHNLSDSKSLGFAGIWTMILMIGLSVGGTLVMRKYQTPLAVGFFIGVVIMMSFQMFSLTILFVGGSYLAKEERTLFNNTDTNIHTNQAAAVFSFFMFALYAIFGAVLVKHRSIVIKEISPITEKLPPIISPSPRLSRDDNDKSLAPPVSV
nr:conserved hypothetical protein [Albugo laibachii Nc14]|eukprot:CCA25334.1 conserved hypothetical protein [Albugo laibachii Nc14]